MPAIPGVIQPLIRRRRTKKEHFTRQAKAKADRLANKNLDPINLDPNACPNLLSQLTDDSLSSKEEKVRKAATLYRKWKVEDRDILCDEALKLCQRQRCMDIGEIVFSFTLQRAQVDTIWTLFYERHDLLLVAKTGFGKSLMFQLLLFMINPTGVVIILMPLKLLQAEQSAMIKRLPHGKAIVLNSENNHKDVQL